MSEVLNPVDLENQIQDVKNTIHRGVEIFKQKYKAFLDAQTAHEQAESVAFLMHDGPQTEKRHAARIATVDHKQAVDDARAEYKYTEKKLLAFMAELSALQNLNRGVRAMFNAERGWGS